MVSCDYFERTFSNGKYLPGNVHFSLGISEMYIGVVGLVWWWAWSGGGPGLVVGLVWWWAWSGGGPGLVVGLVWW